jgi:hypothetical protein
MWSSNGTNNVRALLYYKHVTMNVVRKVLNWATTTRDRRQSKQTRKLIVNAGNRTN